MHNAQAAVNDDSLSDDIIDIDIAGDFVCDKRIAIINHVLLAIETRSHKGRLFHVYTETLVPDVYGIDTVDTINDKNVPYETLIFYDVTDANTEFSVRVMSLLNALKDDLVV